MSEDVERVARETCPEGPGHKHDPSRNISCDWSLRHTREVISHLTPTPQWSVEFTEPLNGERVTWLFDSESEAREFAQTDDTSGNYKHVVTPPLTPDA